MQLQPEKSRKILFLYFELAGYTVACINRLAELHPAEIHVVRYPVNPVAPFNFTFRTGINTYERSGYTTEALIDLCHSINPDTIYVCGWSDKGYTAVAKSFHKKIPVILTLDNPWLGTFKQYLASIAGPFFLKKIFTHCWVPGAPNALYAKKLGFRNHELFQGLYSADTGLFHGYYNSFRQEKENAFPHRFIFVGRYTLLKGVLELWEAFSSLTAAERGDWELWCVGKGELEHAMPEIPSIKNCGFIQPEALAPVLQNTGVFVLPAHYEHWGVVVHEYAAAGFPIISTATTSAASAFLREGENGYYATAKNTASLKEVLLKVIRSSDKDLIRMGKKSREISDTITPTTWANTLWNIHLLN